MTGLQLIRDLCNAKLEGDAVGSTEITLIPDTNLSGSFKADTMTAGLINANFPRKSNIY